MRTLIILFCFISFCSVAQHTNFTDNNHWRLQREEFLITFSITNFLGDLGGRDQIGTDFSPIDLDWGMTRVGMGLGYRYRFRPWVSGSFGFKYNLFRGDDKLTKEPYRNYRNLHFRTHQFGAYAHLELIVLYNERNGKRYSYKGLNGHKHKNTWLYLYSGFKFFAFIPQAKKDGEWQNLRPLKTEGQGLPNGPNQYGLFNYSIPFGIGYKIAIDELNRISFEVSYSKTFTDYLDDVSGDYYDNSKILDELGVESAYFADPSDKSKSNWTNPGEMRGDPDELDAYLNLNINYTRNITYRHRRHKTKWLPRF